MYPYRAFHYAKDSGNFGRKSHGKARIGSFRPEHLLIRPNGPTEICRSILTNRLTSLLLFTYAGNSENE